MNPATGSLDPGADPGAASRFPIRVHARALAALGRDLVTDEVVAVMELVKNSYDALATSVEVRVFPDGNSPGEAGYIEVADDGHGMDYETIRDVWCVIATPSRAETLVAESGSRARAVTGEKGLGRLAAARLGDDIRVRTRKSGFPALEFSLNWSDLFGVGHRRCGHPGVAASRRFVRGRTGNDDSDRIAAKPLGLNQISIRLSQPALVGVRAPL